MKLVACNNALRRHELETIRKQVNTDLSLRMNTAFNTQNFTKPVATNKRRMIELQNEHHSRHAELY